MKDFLVIPYYTCKNPGGDWLASWESVTTQSIWFTAILRPFRSEVVKILAMFGVLRGVGDLMLKGSLKGKIATEKSEVMRHRSKRHEAIGARIHNFDYDRWYRNLLPDGDAKKTYWKRAMWCVLFAFQLLQICLVAKSLHISCCCFMTWLLHAATHEVVLRHQHVSKESCSQLANGFVVSTWRIILVSKWLITMVNKSHK